MINTFLEFVKECAEYHANSFYYAAQDVMSESNPQECRENMTELETQFPEIARFIKKDIEKYDKIANADFISAQDLEENPIFVQNLIDETAKDFIEDFDLKFIYPFFEHKVIFKCENEIEFFTALIKMYDEYSFLMVDKSVSKYEFTLLNYTVIIEMEENENENR